MKRKFYDTFIFVVVVFLLLIQNTYSQRYWNAAAQFDGNSYIAVAPGKDLSKLSGSFTVECWFNTSSTSSSTLFGNKRFRLLLDSTSGGLVGRIQTNATTRLRTKPDSYPNLSPNKWCHLACSYDSTSGLMNFYINGFQSSFAVIPDSGIVPGNDSLYIGTSVYGSFVGMMDDIRIWNRTLSGTEIMNHMRIPYVGLLNYAIDFGQGIVMSTSFDYYIPIATEDLILYDGSNHYENHGVKPVSLGDHPSKTITINPSLDLTLTKGGYVKIPSNPDIELTKPLTVETWIYPLSATGGDIQYIIRKGKDYQFYIGNNGNIYYAFGEEGFASKISKQTIPSNKWTHVAITCSPAGLGKLYINGKPDTSYSFQAGSTPGQDTLFIGANANTSLYFRGYIDAVKISNYEKSEKEINNQMFRIVDRSNRPSPPKSTVSLDFDYTAISSSSDEILYYAGNARNSVIGVNDYVPVSPIIGSNVLNYEEYNIRYSGKRIPQFNTAGYMEDDSLDFPFSGSISTVQLFIALNHGKLSDLEIYLHSPSGDSTLIWNGFFGINDKIGNIVTVFDDNAKDTLQGNLYTDFGPYITPAFPMNRNFTGKDSKGTWKLSIIDFYNGNTGYLYAWGLRINSVTGVKDLTGSIPKTYSLEQNYPNPFNPSTTIKFAIPKTSFVNLVVYDILGRQVKTLVNGEMKEGFHEVELNGNDLSSGIYFYSLNVDNQKFTKKMLLLK